MQAANDSKRRRYLYTLDKIFINERYLSDEEFATYLSIPIEKVRFFKRKLKMWENNILAKRRAKVNAKRLCLNKREGVSPEDRFKKARELVGRNFNTNEISKILKISERSVTRFKKRMREEKRKLKAEGKLHSDPNDVDNSFKYLKENEKFKRAKLLFEKNLSFAEISEISKVSERTARRWRERITKILESDPALIEEDNEPKEENEQPLEDENLKPKRQRRLYYDSEKVKYAIELMQNGLSNKEMSMLLELSIANVRKLKVNIINGTVDELIDNSAYHYSNANKSDDPLYGMDGTSIVSCSSRRKQKASLTERDMHIVRLLRDKNVRTMDIAKMVGISERSVTRLITKSRESHVHEYNIDVLDDVERLMTVKDQILEGTDVDFDKVEELTSSADTSDVLNDVIDDSESYPTSFSQNYISKSSIGMNLIQMKVKPDEIAKMLDVTEKQVQKWKKMMFLKTEEVKTKDNQEFIIEEINDIE